MNGWVAFALTLLALLLCCALVGYQIGWVTYPSNATLARRYLDAVLAEDMDAAVELTTPFCEDQMRRRAREDMERYGGAAVRNVSIESERGTGSDDEIYFVTVRFSYRTPGQAEWQAGQVRITTDYDPPGLRHVACGG